MTLPEEGLQQDGLTSNEWDELNHIAKISEILRAYRRICRWLVQIKDSMVNILADNESLNDSEKKSLRFLLFSYSIEVHSDQLSKYILLFSLFPEIQSYKSADM